MNKISIELIKSLRDRTGAGMNACKEALVANDGNEEKAVDYLRQKGIASQAKRADRNASEGVIAMLLEANAGTLISLHCETDFVARNEDFWGLAKDLCNLTIVNPNDLENQSLNGKKVSEWVTDKSAVIKENIKIGESFTFKANPDSYVFGYIHGSIAPNVGIIGVLVRISKPDEDFGKKISMHIAAMNPEVINYSDISEEIISRETEIAMSKIDSDKPAELKEKMVSGMVKKGLKDRVLMSQGYAFDQKITIEQLCKDKGIEILEFKRISIGNK